MNMSTTQKLACSLVLGLIVSLALSIGNAYADRDPWLQPFSQDSIWNMPIGSNADYQSFGHFPSGGYIHLDHEYHVKTSASDPVRNIYGVPYWTERCSDTSQFQGTIHIPDNFLVGDVTATDTPNNVAAFLKPDGRHLIQLEPLTRCTAGGDVFGYKWAEDVDIQGQGIGGTHWGSGLSGIGGSLRHGELTGTAPIKHALKLNVWGNYLYYNTSDSTKGYRWPADRSDAGAPNQYHGSNPRIEMGALMAIHPGATPQSLGLQTDAGVKLFHALQDYGAYIADDTGWNAYAFSSSVEAMQEFQEYYGYSFNQPSSAGGDAGLFFDDMMSLITNLYVVDNNSASSVGGGGTPRQPLADAAFSAMDSTPPSVPGSLTATSLSTNSVTLDWNAATDNVRVMEYEIYDGSQRVASTYHHTQVTINNLVPGTVHSYKIRAKDSNLNASSFSSAISVTTLDGYDENFDDSLAQSWNLSNAIVEYGRLKLTNWGGHASAIYSGRTFSGAYTYQASLQTDASDNNGKTRVYFNYSDNDNTYFVQFGGGVSNSVELKKRIGGTETTLAVYSGSYSIRDWDWPVIEVSFNNGSITVKAKRNGSSTTLFNGIADSSLASGKVGVGSMNTQSFADNINVTIHSPSETPVSLSNAGFESGSLSGWSQWQPSGQLTAGKVDSGGQRGGSYKLVHWEAGSYQQLTEQTVSVPNGTYRAKVWSRSGGGQTAIHFFVRDYGGSELQNAIETSANDWQEQIIDNIVVTNGSLTFGIWSNAGAGQWSVFDDFELVRLQ
jgi:hypothetical protein